MCYNKCRYRPEITRAASTGPCLGQMRIVKGVSHMKTRILPAEADRLDEVNAFIDKELESYACSPKTHMEISLAVEEIFINIANYAYKPEQGQAEIVVDTFGEPPLLTVGFLDWGKPFNPLDKPDADITLSAEERGIGGLGIYLVKKLMDDVSYVHEDGKNILTIRKRLS